MPEKSSPAKTKTFLIHSCGRPVLIAARSGERRGTTGSSIEASAFAAAAGTVGCSEVIVSIVGVPAERRIPPGQGDSVATGYRRGPSAFCVRFFLSGFQRLEIIPVSGSLTRLLHSQ